MADGRIWYLVRDLDRGRAFFRDTLGFDEVRVDFDEKTADLDRGTTRIALGEGEPLGDAGGVATIDVEDVKAEAERLRAAGVDVGVVLELAASMRLVDVFDADGNRIQLTQPLD